MAIWGVMFFQTWVQYKKRLCQKVGGSSKNEDLRTLKSAPQQFT